MYGDYEQTKNRTKEMPYDDDSFGKNAKLNPHENDFLPMTAKQKAKTESFCKAIYFVDFTIYFHGLCLYFVLSYQIKDKLYNTKKQLGSLNSSSAFSRIHITTLCQHVECHRTFGTLLNYT